MGGSIRKIIMLTLINVEVYLPELIKFAIANYRYIIIVVEKRLHVYSERAPVGLLPFYAHLSCLPDVLS